MTFLSPLDLLSMPSTERDVIRCLVKRPQLTISEIAEETQIPSGQLETLLNQMVNKSRLVKASKNGRCTFAVQFEREQRTTNNLLNDLFPD